MAVITKRETVCDFGREKCDNNGLHRVRLTVDGKSRQLVLCDRHLKPLEPFVATGRAPRPRSKVYKINEIKQRKTG